MLACTCNQYHWDALHNIRRNIWAAQANLDKLCVQRLLNIYFQSVTSHVADCRESAERAYDSCQSMIQRLEWCGYMTSNGLNNADQSRAGAPVFNGSCNVDYLIKLWYKLPSQLASLHVLQTLKSKSFCVLLLAMDPMYSSCYCRCQRFCSDQGQNSGDICMHSLIGYQW